MKHPFVAEISADRIREILDYNASTGQFHWRVRKSQRSKIGDVAGSLRRDGYWTISIENRAYLGHRLAWLHFYGTWPAEFIDHIDGEKANNSLANLRECSHSENHMNIERRGYTEHKRDTPNRFEAYICVARQLTSLGVYPSADLARAAYLAAKAKYHGDFSTTRRSAALNKRRHAIADSLQGREASGLGQTTRSDRSPIQIQAVSEPSQSDLPLFALVRAS